MPEICVCDRFNVPDPTEGAQRSQIRSWISGKGMRTAKGTGGVVLGDLVEY